MPAAVAAQPAGKTARVGVLSPVNARTAPHFVAFEARLGQLGWTDGTTVTIDFRRSDTVEGLADAAADLVRQGASVILAPGPEASLKAARQATTTIPIVMAALNYDPLERGYIASLGRPGGNVTGVFSRNLEQGPKQLELLREALPKAARLGVLWEPHSKDQIPAIDAAARILKVDLLKVEVPPPYDYQAAFAKLRHGRVGGVLMAGSPIFFRDRAKLDDMALRYRLPAVAGARADSRLLLGYGPSLDDLYRRAAEYVDRILRGTPPAELPVQEPATFQLVVNLRTARALGVTLPPALLHRADRVIQ